MYLILEKAFTGHAVRVIGTKSAIWSAGGIITPKFSVVALASLRICKLDDNTAVVRVFFVPSHFVHVDLKRLAGFMCAYSC